ncbi:hypothetical protein KFE25_001549 [Diacronema lutheri]|uniref:AP2/ERF domain-containing protein n=1 Tax=Diacronema lutheri TaxID=2081491 RepID=A0A8J6C0W6_DIALT|nr:hypothetical protein KFE25_001549 [Diacronema lutheri]
MDDAEGARSTSAPDAKRARVDAPAPVAPRRASAALPHAAHAGAFAPLHAHEGFSVLGGLSLKPPGRTTSIYIGVHTTLKKRKPWTSACYWGGKQHHLGYFETEQEAAEAYDRCVSEHGLRRHVNVPDVRGASGARAHGAPIAAAGLVPLGSAPPYYANASASSAVRRPSAVEYACSAAARPGWGVQAWAPLFAPCFPPPPPALGLCAPMVGPCAHAHAHGQALATGLFFPAWATPPPAAWPVLPRPTCGWQTGEERVPCALAMLPPSPAPSWLPQQHACHAQPSDHACSETSYVDEANCSCWPHGCPPDPSAVGHAPFDDPGRSQPAPFCPAMCVLPPCGPSVGTAPGPHGAPPYYFLP